LSLEQHLLECIEAMLILQIWGFFNAYRAGTNGRLSGRPGGQCNIPNENNFIAIAAGETFSLALTPEPATLLLLGLGAVMLRRKRPKC
jgi:hypothetical protein